MYPILIIKSGGKEVHRLYLDSDAPRVYDLPLWPGGAPKNLELGFEFINDEFDAFTRKDRNVALYDLMLY